MGGGMLTSFPTPVLSIAADAVRDLEGRDALSSLWALFTKCKESLQDGRRLENLSWRLWYRDMMRDDFKNRLCQEKENEKEEQELVQENVLLSLQETHTLTGLYTFPTPSESESIPPTSLSTAQDASRSKEPTLSYQSSSFTSATTALPKDHDHASSSPTFSSSGFNPTLDTTFHSISPADPAPDPALDSPLASLQLSKSKSKSDIVLSPGVPVEQFSLSASSSGPKLPCGSTDITPPYTRASSVQPRQRRRLSGPGARINCHTGSSAFAPVCVGRIIYDMLPCSASKGNEGSSSWIKELQVGLRWAGPSPVTTTTTRTLTAVESISTPVMDSYSFLQPPASTPTTKAGSNSTQLMNTGTSTHDNIISSTAATITPNFNTTAPNTTTCTFSHVAPPSPSLSDSYARAHPGEVEVSDATRLETGVGLGPSLSFSASSPASPEVPGNAHIFGLSPNLQLPPRVVVVNPTPNLTPQPTPPASPLLTASTSTFAPTSSVSTSTSTGKLKNRRDWLMLPPHHNQQDSWQQTQDRSRSEDVDSIPSINTIPTDIKPFPSSSFAESVFLSVLPPQLSSANHQSVGEDQPVVSPEPFVQDLETFTNTNSNRHSISSTTTTTSTTESTFSATASTDTAATTTVDEEGEVEGPWKMVGGNGWMSDGAVGSPGTFLLGGVSAHLVSESDPGGIGPSMRLGSLSTIHSMSVRKGGDREGDSVVFTSDEDTDLEGEELRDGKGEGPSTRLMKPITTTAATLTMKKKRKEMGTKSKSKAKTKPVKRNSLRSPTSTLSPSSNLNQPSSSSSMNQKQRTAAPPAPLARRASTGRSSSRSVSRSERDCVGVVAEKGRTNSSVSRSRSRENRGTGGALLGLTAAAATRATSRERKKPVIAIFTKPKQRPKFTLGRSGAKAGGGSAMIKRESSAGDPEGSGVGAGVDGGAGNEKEGERERGREQMMEIIQMQRRQQLLIQQQRQEEMKKGMEDEQRTLAVQLARQDADVREAEIRRQRQRYLLEQLQQQQQQKQAGQEIQGGTNGLLDVSSKRPVRFNIGSNSDEGSGVGSNSKSGSEISGIERLMNNPPVVAVNPTANGKGKERDAGVLEQETKQQEQHQPQDDFRQPEHHPHPQQQQRQMSKQELHQLKMIQQQHLHHQEWRQPQPQPQPQPQQVTDRQLQQEETRKERKHSNPDPNLPPSTSKANIINTHSSPPIKTKHSTHETLNLVSSALAAKVKHTLSDPLLPGQHKRTIVITTSDSDFEDSDDGSWSSEEMGSEDEEERQKEEQQKQEQLLVQQYLQRQQQPQRQPQQQPQPQPQQPLQQQPVQRTQSSNHLPSANHNSNHHHHHHTHTHAATRTQRNPSSRGHRHPSLHAHGQAPNNNQALMQAAHEARRQREMFAKKPTESFQNLTAVARTRSVGLLTQLMNPNPEIFPVGHPYRRGYSSSEIRGVGGSAGGDRGGVRDREIKPLLPLMDVKATKVDKARDDVSHPPPPSRPEIMHRKSSSSSAGGGALGHSRALSALSPPARTLSMQLTKSAAALPVSSQVQAGSVSVHPSNGAEGGHGVVKDLGMTNRNLNVNIGHSSGGYRPKGPPQDQELEDESGSEPESGGGIQVSKSVAQEKLRALAERRGIVTHGNNQPTTTTNAEGAAGNKQVGDEDDVPQWAKVSQPRQPTRTRSQDQYQQPQAPNLNTNRHSINGHYLGQLNVSALNHTTPIPVGHPYNLPPPAPPSTPRTTRRLMLSTELSESLRRNLLWERQLSKVNLAATMRRSASGGGSRHSVLGGLQPLTTGPSMVQLHPKGTNRHPNPGSPARARQEGGEDSGGGGVKKERRASGGAIPSGAAGGPVVYDESERERRKRLAMARNRSWANDYHYSGW